MHLIERLYQLDIFISDPADAAALVNKISDNPWAWWASENRIGEVKKFAEIFVDSSDKLVSQLLNISRSLVSS